MVKQSIVSYNYIHLWRIERSGERERERERERENEREWEHIILN